MKEYGPKDSKNALVGCSDKSCPINQGSGVFVKNTPQMKDFLLKAHPETAGHENVLFLFDKDHLLDNANAKVVFEVFGEEKLKSFRS